MGPQSAAPAPHQPPAGIHGILSVLADGAEQPAGSRRTPVPDRLRWLPVSSVGPLLGAGWMAVPQDRATVKAAEELGRLDAIRPGEHTLRVGWLWVVGTVHEGGQPVHLAEPLVTVPVRIGSDGIVAAGEPELSRLIDDVAERHRLELALDHAWDPRLAAHGPEVPRLELPHLQQLSGFARQVAAAAGMDVPRPVPAHGLVPADASIRVLSRRDGLGVVVGLGLYATATTPDFSAAGSLRLWHQRVGTTWTALHAMYLDRPAPPVQPGPDVPNAFRLTSAQQQAVALSRSAPVTVIAGAPGTGKTHTIAAIVGDAVARGRSVLVATRSEAAVEAVTELVTSRPGPEPVVFGSGVRRARLGDDLAAGHPSPVPGAEVDRLHAATRRAVSERDQVWTEVVAVLDGLALMDRHGQAARLRDRLPGLTRSDVSLFEVEALVARVGLTPPPWWAVGRRRSWNRLTDLLGVSTPPAAEDLHHAVGLARAARGLHSAQRDGVPVLAWDELVAAQEAVERCAGRWLEAVVRDERRLSREVRAARAALATALRAGRATRRARLAELGPAVTRALPVWIGTLGDVDDLLPMSPAMFDLVVLDEASSIDQPRAATALLRGARAVVVGDPRQLRHVSFVATDTIAAAVSTHLPSATPALAAKLDVRQNSAFDTAAAVTSVRWLDEHFRSAAHLFDFVGRRLYDERVAVATTTPATDATDCIVVTRLQGDRSADKVVQPEVDWVIDRLVALRAAGVTSVGVISPFRAQADAIVRAVFGTLGSAGIGDLGLRVGTVHAFQGMERDVVLVSLGIGRQDGPRTWRFADDPHLFAVMATRARQRMEWVVSAEPPAGSLIGDYLAQQDHPPRPQRGIRDAAGWTSEVAGGLSAAGVAVAAPYVAGRHRLDLCVHDDRAHLGVETALHPDGPHAHARRHLELRRAGWPLVTALPAQWGSRPAELVVDLHQRLRDLGRTTP